MLSESFPTLPEKIKLKKKNLLPPKEVIFLWNIISMEETDKYTLSLFMRFIIYLERNIHNKQKYTVQLTLQEPNTKEFRSSHN